MDEREGLPSYPDNFFDLAIVDPPYGIDIGQMSFAKSLNAGKNALALRNDYSGISDWDNSIPDRAYFNQLRRVSKNQIIWGWNYYVTFLQSCKCYIIWDKRTDDKYNNNFGDCEQAWTSFDKPPKVFRYLWSGMLQGDMKNKETRIHPTQKPVKLYQRTLTEFAKPGDLILDTHVGSASSLIAFESMGFNYHAFELNSDIYKAAKRRMSAGIQSAIF